MNETLFLTKIYVYTTGEEVPGYILTECESDGKFLAEKFGKLISGRNDHNYVTHDLPKEIHPGVCFSISNKESCFILPFAKKNNVQQYIFVFDVKELLDPDDEEGPFLACLMLPLSDRHTTHPQMGSVSVQEIQYLSLASGPQKNLF